MNTQPTDQKWMELALKLAGQAAVMGEVPIGAVIVQDEQMVAQAFNRREVDHNPLAHAELLAIEEASLKLGCWRLTGCTLYVTIEPCPMCAGALVNARVDRLVYGAKDPKAGAIDSLYQIGTDNRLNHRIEICSGVMEQEAAHLMSGFFKKLRQKDPD